MSQQRTWSLDLESNKVIVTVLLDSGEEITSKKPIGVNTLAELQSISTAIQSTISGLEDQITVHQTEKNSLDLVISNFP